MATADRTTKLGDDLTVSAIGFGAGALTSAYGDVDDAESLATLNRCLDLDVTFIDTADVYGGGRSERLIAKLLTDRRDEVTLATKFGIASNPADHAAGQRPVRGDAAYVRQCIDESLARLRTDAAEPTWRVRSWPPSPRSIRSRPRSACRQRPMTPGSWTSTAPTCGTFSIGRPILPPISPARSASSSG